MRDVERTMLEGRADLTRQLIEDLKGAGGVEQITLLNFEGRQAFDKTTEVDKTDVEKMKRMTGTKAPEVIKDVRRLIFYKPLVNSERCRSCHADDPEILGAVKTSFSIEKEYAKAMGLINFVIFATVFAAVCFSLVLWYMIRKTVITPIKSLETAAVRLSRGDLSFEVDVRSSDEIGRFSSAIRDSLMSISNILRRVQDVTARASRVTGDVEEESRKVVNGTALETEAIDNISSSIEEMKAGIAEIAEGTDGLAASAEETAASMEQLVTSITQITTSTGDLSSAVESTSTSVEELSATISEVARNAEELAGAAEETQTAIIEISTSIREVEQRAKESSMLSDKVKTEAVTFGMSSVEKTIAGMRDIKVSVEKTAGCISKLGVRSEEIDKILNVIDEITDETTMLALNAAILAAQAGEQGKGFSVVADEIKSLAEKTAASTQEIAELIEAVQREVSNADSAMKEGLKSVEMGFKLTGEAVDALRKIVESSRKSSDMAAAIEHSTTEQARAAHLVSEAMERVLGMVGQIAQATTEQNKGIQLIVRATEKISDVTGHVKTATGEQSLNTRQISRSIETVSEKSQQISRAINEQKIGSGQIWASLEKIKDLPKENRARAFKLNRLVKELQKDAELSVTEMNNFKFAEDLSGKVLRMGIVPLESPAVMFKKFSPLVEYLSVRLKRKVDLRVAVDFAAAIEDLGKGETQFCFMTPSTYIEAHKKFNVRVLVKLLREGKPFQHSVIVAGSASGIESVEDIKGRSFAFGDPQSTSSHIAPRAMLLDAGIDVKDLLYYNYLGHHDDVAKAVLHGDFDAGGIMETTARKFADSGLKLLKFSEDIPEFNICVSETLEAAFVEELRSVLTAADISTKEGSEALTSINDKYTGFMEAADTDYDNVRVMMKKIGMI